MRAYALTVVAVLVLNGCGLMMHGSRQIVHVVSEPPGARVSTIEGSVVAPGDLDVWRGKELRIFRATKEGYAPACKVVACGRDALATVLDAPLFAIPLLFDRVAGAHRECPDVISMTLSPSDAGSAELPTDDAILDQLALEHVDVCSDRPTLRAAGTRILVTSGAIDRPYRVLGPVGISIEGEAGPSVGKVIMWGPVVAALDKSFKQATMERVNAHLQLRAVELYKWDVDAVINVAYLMNPRHDVDATGVAVHFVDAASNPPPATADSRLRELDRLRDDGLIDQREYEQKRAEILRGL